MKSYVTVYSPKSICLMLWFKSCLKNNKQLTEQGDTLRRHKKRFEKFMSFFHGSNIMKKFAHSLNVTIET